ncbi:MAG: HAD family hydrolase [Treponema sp.]|nr:HAD family hydrolase [Treponema sp.]
MKIAIDMDNTIIDELGQTLRPGILDFLEKLSCEHELVLWTNSKRLRTMEILEYFDIRRFFVKIISRENYDPEDRGNRKDLNEYGYDIIIDDDFPEIEFNESRGKRGFLVESYRKGKKMDEAELGRILKVIGGI